MANWKPASWCCMPTAIIHLLGVESLPIYLITCSWYYLAIGIEDRIAHEGPSGAVFGRGLANGTVYTPLGCRALPYMPLRCTAYVLLNKTTMQPLNATSLEEGMRQHGGATQRTVKWACFLCTLAAAVALLVYEVFRFTQRGTPRSFCSGAYLCFVWDIESSKSYKMLVAGMAAGPRLFASSAGPMLFAFSLRSFSWERLAQSALGLTVLLLSFLRPTFPSMPVHQWHNTEFEKVQFRWSLADFVLQSCDRSGVAPIDAPWSAEHGHPARLKHLLTNPSGLDSIVMHHIRRIPAVAGV